MVMKEFPKGNEQDNVSKKASHLSYLYKTMNGKKQLIKEIIDVFLRQIPQDLSVLNEAVKKKDYLLVKNFAHTMKSSVSVMGISTLVPILHAMEESAKEEANSDGRDERMGQLNIQLNSICNQAIGEIEKDKLDYI
jgi:HPt (histidine-containing phosphotransfer) domain-containing protein